MTLQQLKYVVTVAETGTITEAAGKLYISQPSLTNAIHELEREMQIVIFNRTNKGISLSKEGDIFLGYARQVLEQAEILEDKYKGEGSGKKQFCVSTQHYSFAVNAFVDLIKKYGQEEYDFSLRETQTYEIIEDVAKMRSEIGILFLNDFNEFLYKSDRNFGWIFASASLLAVFVACLGLWIVTLFSTLSRLKEVGIRKVLGANKTSLFFVLTKELLLLTVWASAIGIPVSAVLMNAWLETYAFHISLSWWIYAATFVLLMLIAFLTVFQQVWRTIRQKPMRILKYE